MKTYTPCDSEVAAVLAGIIRNHRPELKKLQVTFDLIFVLSDAEGPALSLYGYPCYAVIRRTSAKERAAGRSDVEIVIDAERYSTLSVASRVALLHHEITHLELAKDRFGAMRVDSAGRPVLAMRKHDRQFGWFDEIAQRYGTDSIEVQQARELLESGRQTYFEFPVPAEDAATTPETAAPAA